MHTRRKALRIVCFVRARNDEEARERVEEAVRYHDMYDPSLVSTTTVFECRAVKLNQTELGLSRDVLLDLRQHATTIIHVIFPRLNVMVVAVLTLKSRLLGRLTSLFR